MFYAHHVVDWQGMVTHSCRTYAEAVKLAKETQAAYVSHAGLVVWEAF